MNHSIRLSTSAIGSMLVVTFFLANCAREPTSLSIGAILPLTGDVASYGTAVRQGIELAVDEVNRNGGLSGRSLKVIYEDDKGDPKEAVTAALKLISVTKVPAILGGVPSSVTLAIAPIAERSHVIVLSPASSSPDISNAGDYIFRNYPSDNLEGALVAGRAKEEGCDSIAVLTANTEYGNGLNRVFRSSFEAANGRVVYADKYPEGTRDFRTYLLKMRASGAPCTFIVGYGKELGTLVRQARESRMANRFFSTVNFQDAETIATGGASVEGAVFSTPVFDAASADSQVVRFVESFHRAFGKDPDVWSAHGYDALMLLAEAMRRGGTTPDEIKRSLYGTKDYPGVSGVTTFDQNGDVQKAARFMTVRGGQFVPVAGR